MGTEAQTGPVKIPVGPCPALVAVTHSRPSGGLLGGGVVRDGAAPGPDAMSHLGSARQGHRLSSHGVLWAFGEGLLSPALPVVTWGPPGAELGPWHWRIGRLHQLGVWALACNPTLLNVTDGDLQSLSPTFLSQRRKLRLERVVPCPGSPREGGQSCSIW